MPGPAPGPEDSADAQAGVLAPYRSEDDQEVIRVMATDEVRGCRMRWGALQGVLTGHLSEAVTFLCLDLKGQKEPSTQRSGQSLSGEGS